MSSDGETADCPPVLSSKGFSIENRIASGAFSDVYKAKWTQMPGKDLAVKRIHLSKVPKDWVKKNLKNEMKIIKILKHPNIVKVYELVKTQKYAYIFMDLAKKGSVLGFIERTEKPLTESQAKLWFGDVSKGLSYIHSRGIAHRDIKPDNFLISEDYTVLLSDFGFACIDVTYSSEKIMKGTICGTGEYMAPEVRTVKSGLVYDAKAADLYSMGISLYFMINNAFPFDTQSLALCLRKQKARQYNYKINPVSKDVKDLIYAMLDPEPKTRITAKLLENHIWFKS